MCQILHFVQVAGAHSTEQLSSPMLHVTAAYGKLIVGFKVNNSMLIQQVIQNPIQVRLLSAVKREKLNPW
jgi:hypothetical protein